MKTLDYAYETAKEFYEEFVEMAMELGKFILNILLAILIYGTIPLWVIPYLIIKKRKDELNDRCRNY